MSYNIFPREDIAVIYKDSYLLVQSRLQIVEERPIAGENRPFLAVSNRGQ